MTTMQQETTIRWQQAQQRQDIDVLAIVRHKYQQLNNWLDGRSGFYSRICEFSVTRRTALRVNMVTACILLGAIAVEQAPLAALTAMAVAAYMVYRLNQQDKQNNQEQEGGYDEIA